jgi:hypothetical protein
MVLTALCLKREETEIGQTPYLFDRITPLIL